MPYQIVDIQSVDIRSVFPTEPKDFTPWVASNLARIARLTGLEDLELVQEEHPVGEYSCDIVARHSEGFAIIENQFGRSDHNHFGKLMVYAGGVKANCIVLIAEEIREEHRAAIDYWNTLIDDKCSIYAIEVGLITLDGANVAVNLDVVCRPNHWANTVNSPSPPQTHSPRVLALCQTLAQEHQLNFRASGNSAYLRIATHTYLSAVINNEACRVEIAIWKPPLPENEEWFAKYRAMLEGFADANDILVIESVSKNRTIYRAQKTGDDSWVVAALLDLLKAANNA